MKIIIKRETLSDGSFVFNVHVPALVVAATDEGTAQDCAHAIAGAINEHGVQEDAEVICEY